MWGVLRPIYMYQPLGLSTPKLPYGEPQVWEIPRVVNYIFLIFLSSSSSLSPSPSPQGRSLSTLKYLSFHQSISGWPCPLLSLFWSLFRQTSMELHRPLTFRHPTTLLLSQRTIVHCSRPYLILVEPGLACASPEGKQSTWPPWPPRSRAVDGPMKKMR